MKTYGQYCALAKALDVIGDRWSLLIIRELLIRSPCRYTDLRNGLPGIATNLLADRLSGLEEAGVILRRAAPPPIATDVFELTPRGKDLEPAIHQLGRWGGPLLAKPPGHDTFQTHWLALPAKLYLRDHAPTAPTATIELRTGEEPLLIEVSGGEIRVGPGSVDDPDLILTGDPEAMVKVLTGRLTIARARAAGMKIKGRAEVLGRVQPNALRS